MAEELICGLDVGSTKIATIVSVQPKEDEKLRIVGFDVTKSKGVKRGLIVDIDQVTGALEESVEKAERMVGKKISSAYVSVGGPHISSMNSQGVVAVSDPQAEINEEDVARVVEAARAVSISNTKQIIEVIPRGFTVDGQEGIKNPIGMSGVRLEVETHIITASLTNLKNLDRCMSDLGLVNDGFIFSGLASAQAVLTDTDRELGVVLVDIGGGKTDICLYEDGSLAYSSSIAIGARHITNDIAVGLRVSLESAEKIKLHLSKQKIQGSVDELKDDYDLSSLKIPESLNAMSAKTVVDGIIGARLEEIFKMVGEEIERSGYGKEIPAGLVITGGGSLTVGITDVGKKVLRLPLRIGRPENITGLIDEIIEPQYSTTAGLILYGRKNIIDLDRGMIKFNKIFKDFSFGNTLNKFKEIIKQFIP
ncbi:cell division protein FtsA [Candidatus Roizmanbacteria bacterium RIFCSPHIGHO2_12_FULL_33_9]|uniref:Cell division protein FtsA n=1 Tax=Candidatus Roizmanbacteria bacterium RIFCSPHIGHO2_12_FULL_33_9 TaxID=1802045 RepID=A0A1F7HJY4_9BACT|nr:MAG: cell division protein FtsA [Candidatus Roizmanbacteria bacterium RIFCSPHIGHO2_12_FULL_33_9]